MQTLINYGLITVWVGGVVMWLLSFLVFGLSRIAIQNAALPLVCDRCGYPLDAYSSERVCSDCGSPTADRNAIRQQSRKGGGTVAIAAAVFCIVIAFGINVWDGLGAAFEGAVLCLPLAIAVAVMLWMQRRAVSARWHRRTAIGLVVTYAITLAILLFGVAGTSSTAIWSTFMLLSSILLGPLLGYCFVPSIVTVLREA